MTLVVGAACLVGGVAAIRSRVRVRPPQAAAAFALMAAVQVGLFWLSLATPISSDPRFMTWLHHQVLS